MAECAAASFNGLLDGKRRFDLMEPLDEVGRKGGWTGALPTHFRMLLKFARDEDWTRGNRPIVCPTVKVAKRLEVSSSQVRRNERLLLRALSFCVAANHRCHGKPTGRRNGSCLLSASTCRRRRNGSRGSPGWRATASGRPRRHSQRLLSLRREACRSGVGEGMRAVAPQSAKKESSGRTVKHCAHARAMAVHSG